MPETQLIMSVSSFKLLIAALEHDRVDLFEHLCNLEVIKVPKNTLDTMQLKAFGVDCALKHALQLHKLWSLDIIFKHHYRIDGYLPGRSHMSYFAYACLSSSREIVDYFIQKLKLKKSLGLLINH